MCACVAGAVGAVGAVRESVRERLWVRGCVGARVRGCVGARVHGCAGARVCGCKGARVRGCVRTCVGACLECEFSIKKRVVTMKKLLQAMDSFVNRHVV